MVRLGAYVVAFAYVSINTSAEYLRLSRTEETIKRLAAIVESCDDAIIGETLDGTIVSWNPGAERIYGYSTDEAQGRPRAILVPPDCPDEETEAFARVRGGERVDCLETVRRTKDGRTIAVSLRVSPIEDSQGRIIGVSTIARDITDRKRAEKELEELNERLEGAVEDLTRANKELQNFAHITAHDLKTPLRAITTLADWLSTDYAERLDERGREQIGLLVTKARQMAALIDDILEYSRLGQETADKQQLDLNAIVSAVITEIAPPENIRISTEGELPTIMAGKTHAIQIFQNLIGNAVKYMDKPDGRIIVGCTEQNGSWKFSVADNGPGIEPKHFERVFEMFQTLAPREGIDSTGIGLSIVKKLVELDGGRVWVESTPGQGSTFFFTLPRQMGQARTKPQQTGVSTCN
jgi:PAS domain S-box-containing protein